jgi:hypothetical protein
MQRLGSTLDFLKSLAGRRELIKRRAVLPAVNTAVQRSMVTIRKVIGASTSAGIVTLILCGEKTLELLG